MQEKDYFLNTYYPAIIKNQNLKISVYSFSYHLQKVASLPSPPTPLPESQGSTVVGTVVGNPQNRWEM
jgi:hypothetical protein